VLFVEFHIGQLILLLLGHEKLLLQSPWCLWFDLRTFIVLDLLPLLWGIMALFLLLDLVELRPFVDVDVGVINKILRQHVTQTSDLFPHFVVFVVQILNLRVYFGELFVKILRFVQEVILLLEVDLLSAHKVGIQFLNLTFKLLQLGLWFLSILHAVIRLLQVHKVLDSICHCLLHQRINFLFKFLALSLCILQLLELPPILWILVSLLLLHHSVLLPQLVNLGLHAFKSFNFAT
jgi:hypothetical protein